MNASLVHVVLVLAASIVFTGCSGGGSSASNEGDTLDREITNTSPAPKAIDFSLLTDEALRSCVNETGAKDTSLQILNCSRRNVESLAGVEQFADLRVLVVHHNKIQSIDELSELQYLSHVDLNNNEIHSLTALSNARYLTRLQVNGNALDSLDGISELPNLKRLYASNNRINDLAVLNSLAAIEHVAAENNPSALPNSLPQSLKSFRL